MTTEHLSLFAAGYVTAYLVSWLQRRVGRWRADRKFRALVAATAPTCEYVVQPGIYLDDVIEVSGATIAEVRKLNGGEIRWEVGTKILLPRAACLYLADAGQDPARSTNGKAERS